MSTSTPKSVDLYLEQGCGRCSLVGTPECKVHRWVPELQTFRRWVLEAGLKEELKWSFPCYTLEGKNVLMVSAFKEYASVNFLKGVVMQDPQAILTAPGENSQFARQIRVTSLDELMALESVVRAYIQEAIRVERDGIEPPKRDPSALELPQELTERLAADDELREAFERLTPGRQRGYALHIAGAKQAATRESRITKCRPKILEGLGLQDDPR